jgi:hypothetical protein
MGMSRLGNRDTDIYKIKVLAATTPAGGQRIASANGRFGRYQYL